MSTWCPNPSLRPVQPEEEDLEEEHHPRVDPYELLERLFHSAPHNFEDLVLKLYRLEDSDVEIILPQLW